MTLILYFEDCPSTDGRVLTETDWPHVAPLMAKSGALGWTLVGAVSAIERIRVVGQVAVVGTPSISMVPYTGLSCEATFSGPPFEREYTKAGDRILRGVWLRAVHLGERSCWPGMTIR